MNKFSTLCSAAVVIAAGVFADMPSKSKQSSGNNPCGCLEQGMGLPTDMKCFPAAYNAPAEVAVSCGWDFDVFASFLYWHASQDDMDIAHIPPGGEVIIAPINVGTVAYQTFTYKPGFKVGIGFNTNYDDWTGWVEYTWFHQKHSTTQTAPTQASGVVGFWLSQDWFLSAFNLGSSVSSSWKMNLDMVDADFSRPYYQGTQLTVAPYAGLRALWIHQNFKITMLPPFDGGLPSTYVPPTVSMHTHSWAIGPNAGVLGHWLLGMGFRFEGKTAGSLLFTQYTTIAHKEADGSAPPVFLARKSHITSNYNCLRPMFEMGLGLGWGSYLYCQQYYIDFSARYDFNYLWDQNMMRPFVSQLQAYADQAGDLAIHGLTVSGRFDF